MTNIREVTVIEPISGESTEHIIIDHPDGSFTSMTKERWDELEAAKENGTIS